MIVKKKKVMSKRFFEVCSHYGLNYLIDSETGQFLKFPDDYLIEEERYKK